MMVGVVGRRMDTSRPLTGKWILVLAQAEDECWARAGDMCQIREEDPCHIKVGKVSGQG